MSGERYYGVRIGMRVVEKAFGFTSEPYTVVALGVTDNNRVYGRGPDGSVHPLVAEYCEVVQEPIVDSLESLAKVLTQACASFVDFGERFRQRGAKDWQERAEKEQAACEASLAQLTDVINRLKRELGEPDMSEPLKPGDRVQVAMAGIGAGINYKVGTLLRVSPVHAVVQWDGAKNPARYSPQYIERETPPK